MLRNQPKSNYNHNQFLKLKNYIDYFYSFFLWNYRFEYLKIFQNFTNFAISGDQFADEFIQLRNSYVREFDQLIHELETNFEPITTFLIDEKAFYLEDILRETYENCDIFVSDKLLDSISEISRDFGEINEIEFHNQIQKATFNIQKQL